MSTRGFLKLLADIISWVIVAPLAYLVYLTRNIGSSYRIFQVGSHFMSLFPGILGVYLRRQYYRIVFDLKSKDFSVEFGTIFAMPGSTIGDNVYIGAFCSIGLADIQSDVLLGSNVDLIAGPQVHNFDRLDIPIRLQGGELRKVVIGQGSWVGNGAIVLNDIGNECVVGAGSVVVKSCDPYGVYAGNPAKFIKSRQQPRSEEDHGRDSK